MKFYYVSKSTTFREKLVFSLLIQGHKTGSIKGAAGINGSTVADTIKSLTGQGYLSSDLKPEIDISRQYIKVDSPEHPNITSWIVTAMAGVKASFARQGKAVSLLGVAKWLNISEGRAMKCEIAVLGEQVKKLKAKLAGHTEQIPEAPEVAPEQKEESTKPIPEADREDIEQVAWEVIKRVEKITPAGKPGYANHVAQLVGSIGKEEGTACANLLYEFADIETQWDILAEQAGKKGLPGVRAMLFPYVRGLAEKQKRENPKQYEQPKETETEKRWYKEVEKGCKRDGLKASPQQIAYALERAITKMADNPVGYAIGVLRKTCR